jgi:GNAT superfamily N-acetyltransferase
MKFQIRPAQPDDAPHIAHVHVESWRTTYRGIVPDPYIDAMSKDGLTANWQTWLADSSAAIFVAEEARGIFGFVGGGALRTPVDEGYRGDYDAELYILYLLESHQKQGAGHALVDALVRRLHAQGKKKMLVWVLEANPAVAFYKRLGATLILRKITEIGGVELPDLALGWATLDWPTNKSGRIRESAQLPLQSRSR